jgi:hypothetical protein
MRISAANDVLEVVVLAAAAAAAAGRHGECGDHLVPKIILMNENNTQSPKF